MKTSSRLLITAMVAGSMLMGSVLPGFAAERDDLRRLILENRVAGILADLNLTPDQREQLKQVAETYQAAASTRLERLEELLTQRRDALLNGDREAADQIDENLDALVNENLLASNEVAEGFLSGLTERQTQLLRQILPGVARRRAAEASDRTMTIHPVPKPARERMTIHHPGLPVVGLIEVGEESVQVLLDLLSDE